MGRGKRNNQIIADSDLVNPVIRISKYLQLSRVLQVILPAQQNLHIRYLRLGDNYFYPTKHSDQLPTACRVQDVPNRPTQGCTELVQAADDN